MTAIRDYFVFEDYENDLKFAKWAFGDDYCVYVDGIKFVEAWNKIHGDALTLSGEGYIGDDAKEMIRLWRESKEE